MTFDTRARRAAQGIHRAVEVMEMSSTKTPQRITRYDQFRQGRSRNQKVAAIIVAVGVPLLLLGALYLLTTNPSETSVPATETPAPTVSEAATPVNGSAESFDPAFTYTLPATWEVGSDSPRYFALRSTETLGASTGIVLLRDVVASSPDCSFRPNRDVGTSSEAMTTWMSTNPAFEATSPRSVDIGGASGYRVDLRLVEGWDQTCEFADVPLVTGKPDGQESWSVGPSQRTRVFVLDLPEGGTVTIIAEVDSVDDPAIFMDEAMLIADTFEFPV
jgi:hypothetical protein